MWDLPGPGIEPMFPALADGFLTTGPPGKSKIFLLSMLGLRKWLDYQMETSSTHLDVYIWNSPTWWMWVWASSGSWWWTGKPGMLQSMGSQRARHDWVTELNWTELKLSENRPSKREAEGDCRRENQGKIEVETGVKLLQIKEHLEPNLNEPQWDLPIKPSERWPC